MTATEIAPNVLSWASELDELTRDQVEKTARLPILSGPIALMPDAHLGIGATIGTVMASETAVIPSAVGVDIGCGMAARRVRLRAKHLPDSLQDWVSTAEKLIPAGLGKWHSDDQAGAEWIDRHRPPSRIEDPDRAAMQLGTLGSGNHFIEIALDEEERVWILLHSGSRGAGNKLATLHTRTAKKLHEGLGTQLEDPELAWLQDTQPEFAMYVSDLGWAQAYAMENRRLLLDAATFALRVALGREFEIVRDINCLAAETEVQTRLGVRPIADLAGSVHELLTTGGEWVKAPVESFGTQSLMKVTLSRSGVSKVIHATAGHRWLLRTRNGTLLEATTQELKHGDRLAFAFPPRARDLGVDRLAAARGFVFGDGTRSRNRSTALFCGVKDAAMLSLFEGLGNPPRFYDDRAVVNGLPLEWKDLPTLDAPASELYGWLAGYFAADGDVDKTGRPTLASATRENLVFVRALCTQIGVGTFGIRERRRVGYGMEESSLYLLGLMRGDLDEGFFLVPAHRQRFESGRGAAERRGWNVAAVEQTDRREEVFCAVVEGTEAFVLTDNILTGNCHHNYTEQEEHGGRTLWVTRKGAIRARVGDYGLIPGSMGQKSYVVKGLGNPLSYQSCSHGAGRRMSRRKARQNLSVERLHELMGAAAWQAGHAEALKDEHPEAYKPIDQVMRDQADLVEIVHELQAVANFKGVEERRR